ncbi:MAG TPA: 4-(cytidine 5'-diphospho)-2-C-methyl-D-erythritol kinase [Lacipirellulaceae bacterium]|nr:4-(cytidine 5'-diphospho)-2-C-methyl-D-erythritol kinase [Lacipirellulaceae bacterium]
MFFRSDNPPRMARAPAKLNLYLEITGQRGDGYHELETLMVPVHLADGLWFQASTPTDENVPGSIELEVHTRFAVRPPPQDSNVPAGSNNFIVRALELLRQRSGCRIGARVGLIKHIPVAAGLGGGSSDAAAALRLANIGWKLHWDTDRLAKLAAEIGSDVPFFVYGGAAICRGRGERVERLPSMPTLHFVIAKPASGLSAADVYRSYDQLSQSERFTGESLSVLSKITGRSWGDFVYWMRNGLESAAARLSPWIDQARKVFSELDFVAHQLSGSGSAYFGVCRHAQHARRLASILRTRQLGLVYATRSCQ